MSNFHNQLYQAQIANDAIQSHFKEASSLINGFLTTLKIYDLSGEVCLSLQSIETISAINIDPNYTNLQNFCASRGYMCRLSPQSENIPAHLTITKVRKF